MSQLVDITITNRGRDLDPLSSPTLYGFDVDDITSPIRYNSGLSKSYFSTSQDGGGLVNYESTDSLNSIFAKSKKLLILTVLFRRGVDMGSETMVFVSSKILEDLVPDVNTGGTKFFYSEYGDPLSVEYTVEETVTQIIAQQASAFSNIGINEIVYGDTVSGAVTSNPLFVRDSVTGNIGIGLAASSAKVHIKGIDSTSSNHGLKIDNSANAPLFYVRNDGNLKVTPLGSGTIALEINTGSAQDAIISLATNSSATNRGTIYIENATQTFNFYTRNNDTIFWNGNGAAQSKTLTLFTDTTAKFESSLGVGVSAATNTRLHVKGVSSSSADFSLKLENLASSLALSVRNDGLLSAPLLPTSNAGLVTGDMYVATAATILANGDRVVGWKL